MENNYDLSIIIPCYNLENYITKCLHSILNQNLNSLNIEIICVYDKSNDNTLNEIKIIDDIIQQNYPNISLRLRMDKAGSAGIARNIGLCHATGEYIWFVDGDDSLVCPNAIINVINILRSHNSDGCHFCYNINGKNKGMSPNTIWSYVFKREFLLQHNLRFGEEKVHEDDNFMDKVRIINPYIVEINQSLYNYTFPREGSLIYKYLKEIGQW